MGSSPIGPSTVNSSPLWRVFYFSGVAILFSVYYGLMKLFLIRDVHVSWQISVACVGVVVGTAFYSWLGLGGLGWFLTAFVLILTATWKAKRWTLALALIGGLMLGAWRGGGEMVLLKNYQSLYEKTVQLSGVVSEDADVDKRGNTTLRMKDISRKGEPIAGKIWLSLGKRVDNIQRSDRLEFSGKLQPGFGTFSASIYRPEIIKIERPQPGDVALGVRNWFANAVRQVVAEPQASLGVGYLVGQRRALPPDLDQSLQIAGLTHIVVASGYNLTILVRLARRLFAKVSKYLSTLSAATMTIGFIVITGASPSMSRAGLVTGLSLAAWYYGRAIHPLVLLPLAMAVTVLIDPSYAWGDVGWQLSFAAFAGVIIMAPLIQAYYFGNKKPGTLRQILGETLAAWLWTLPILAVAFGVVSNVAIFANLLILPLVPLAMLLVFVSGLAVLIFPPMSSVLAWPTQILLEYMTSTAQFFANLSWAQSEIQADFWTVGFAYLALGAWCAWMWRKTKLRPEQMNVIE